MGIRTRSVATALLLAALPSVLGAAGAGAVLPGLNPVDQARAKADLLRRSDLPPTVDWKTTALPADGSRGGEAGGQACAAYVQKADGNVVTTGQATAEFSAPGVSIVDVVALTADSRMLATFWKETFTGQLTRCLSASIGQSTSGTLKQISLRRLRLPAFQGYRAAYRLIFQLTVHGVDVRGALDLLALGRGRTATLLFVSGVLGVPQEQATGELEMTLIDLRLLSLLAARDFPASAGSGGAPTSGSRPSSALAA